MASPPTIIGANMDSLNCLDEKVLFFFKNIIQQFYSICLRGNDYRHRRLFFLRNVILEFSKLLNDMDGLGLLNAKYRSWLNSCIIHIRDIRAGYGIRDIAYALLVVWYKRFSDEADIVMRRFVYDVGCWSDIKRFLGLWRELGENCSNGVINRVVNIMIDQLWLDFHKWCKVFDIYMNKREVDGHCCRPNARDYISFAVKWVPREKSSYGWLYDYFVIAWGDKIGWRRFGINRWRRDFRKIINNLYRELVSGQDNHIIIEAKDFVRIAYEGFGEKAVDEARWRIILDQFCSVCSLKIDTIPVVELQYNDFYTDDFWRAISYAILISQRGVIGRFMLICNNGAGCSWIVCRHEDDLLDIIARIRGSFGSGSGGGDGDFRCAIEILTEASEVSGYECKDKLFYIGTHINI